MCLWVIKIRQRVRTPGQSTGFATTNLETTKFIHGYYQGIVRRESQTDSREHVREVSVRSWNSMIREVVVTSGRGSAKTKMRAELTDQSSQNVI